jgi:serine/threonine-protein kinase
MYVDVCVADGCKSFTVPAVLQLRRRAKRYLMSKQWQRAADVCTEGLLLTPSSYKLLRLRALAHAGQSNHAAALVDINQVLQAIPGNSDAWFQKGYAHFHLKEYAASVCL